MPKQTLKVIPDQKRERLTREAACLFAERGFARTDMAEIARRAGVSKGSLYNYFEGKEDLYLYICRDGLDRSRSALYGAIDPDWDIHRQIEHIFTQGVRFALAHPEYIALYLNVASAGMERYAEQLSMEVEKLTADYLKKLIREGIRSKTVRPDIDVNMAAFIINDLYIMFLFSLVSRHFQLRMKEYLQLPEPVGEEAIQESLERTLDFIHRLLKNSSE